jgi:hypothetical protein
MAFRWHDEEADRLQPEADAARAVWDNPDQRAALTREQFKRNLAAREQFATANAQALRLAELIRALMPRWHQRPTMKLREALRRYWKGGRGTARLHESD